MIFGNEILPTHRPEARRDDRELYSRLDADSPINRHKMHMDAVQESLDRLLQTLEESR